MKPLFITIEGGEGSGKSTVIKALQVYFFKKGIPTVITREPGGDKVCEQIRSTILDNEMNIWTEALLFLVARKEHCENVITPALQGSNIVICDRYLDSSIVYQALVGNLSKDKLLQMHCDVNVEIPDVTIVLDVAPEIGLQRITNSSHREINRIDLKGLNFHRKVRQGFLTLAALDENKERMVVVDASGNTKSTLESIVEIIEGRLESTK